MSYYRGIAGDYYTGARGDLFGSIKKYAGAISSVLPGIASVLPTGGIGGTISGALGTLGRIGSLIPGPVGAVAKVGTALVPAVIGAGTKIVKSPVVQGAAGAIAAEQLFGGGGGGKRRRSMNAANVQALRRALRRVDSFRNLAKKSGAMPAVKRFPMQRGDRCSTRTACCK